jgi:hypothetical protein
MNSNANLTELAMLLLSIAAMAVPLFSFVAVLKWAQERRKEREAFYLSEMIKKMADSSSTTPSELLRELDRSKNRRLREGMKLGGFIGSAATAALFIFAAATWTGRSFLVTLIPLFACVALYTYAQFLAPQE